MSLWTRINDALSDLAKGESLTVIFERFRGGSNPERSVGFTIAVIALGAKLAKADGTVTRAEVSAFRRVFSLPVGEEANAARVFNLARQDVAGFDAYAAKIVAMFQDTSHPDNRALFIDLIEGLFHIALADDILHEGEEVFLAHVAEIFGLDARCFRAIRARLVEGAARDPYDVLGVSHEASIETVRAAWRRSKARRLHDGSPENPRFASSCDLQRRMVQRLVR
jgi:DnaJ like chaperone protein